jgi:hypothetical protein
LRDAHRHGDDLGGDALLLQPDRFLDGDLVEGVIDILTPAVSTPVPSAFTRTFTL